jgi:phosphoesterase RecJ-like protein
VDVLFDSAVPPWYEFLFPAGCDILDGDTTFQQLVAGGGFPDPDLVLIVDTDSYNQLPGFEKYLKERTGPVLVIDHHATGDGLGTVGLVEQAAAATAVIVLDLARHAGWPISPSVAEALFTAVASDTGWFRFTNTDSRAFEASTAMVSAGADPAAVHGRLYRNFSHSRLRLMAAMLGTLKLHMDGKLATQHILRKDFEQAGASPEDTENLIDECRRISTVEAAALFVELPDGRVKCSLRSEGTIDVLSVAVGLGGGGHRTAAGAYLSGPIEKAKKRVIEAMARQFGQN